VIDDQVEVLASGAAKALGSFWGGVAAVAKTGWSMGNVLTHKVRHIKSIR
jgi:hypothetical protein